MRAPVVRRVALKAIRAEQDAALQAVARGDESVMNPVTMLPEDALLLLSRTTHIVRTFRRAWNTP